MVFVSLCTAASCTFNSGTVLHNFWTPNRTKCPGDGRVQCPSNLVTVGCENVKYAKTSFLSDVLFACEGQDADLRLKTGLLLMNKSRVPDHNGVSLPYIMLEIHHSGREPSKASQ